MVQRTRRRFQSSAGSRRGLSDGPGRTKILLIAKPWAGGLAAYYYAALEEMFPGEVRWLSTRPVTLAGQLQFRLDRNSWWGRIRGDIDQAESEVRFFIGSRPEFRGLKPHPGNVLYQIDAVRMEASDLEAFSRVFVSDRGYQPEVAALARPSQFAGVLPFACHPPLHFPIAGKRRRGVCFIANRDPKRDAFVARLLDCAPQARIIGNHFGVHPLFWRRPLAFRSAVPYAKLAQVYARYQASLNIHAQVVREGTNQRTFEAAACGVPQVVERRHGIEEYFEPGREIILFDDLDEMCARLAATLADRAGSLEMAERARQRALSQHTYYHRVATALADLLPGIQKQAALKINAAKSAG
jgi:spore maturation protein CgeB